MSWSVITVVVNQLCEYSSCARIVVTADVSVVVDIGISIRVTAYVATCDVALDVVIVLNCVASYMFVKLGHCHFSLRLCIVDVLPQVF